jgi:hypothetical protein
VGPTCSLTASRRTLPAPADAGVPQCHRPPPPSSESRRHDRVCSDPGTQRPFCDSLDDTRWGFTLNSSVNPPLAFSPSSYPHCGHLSSKPPLPYTATVVLRARHPIGTPCAARRLRPSPWYVPVAITGQEGDRSAPNSSPPSRIRGLPWTDRIDAGLWVGTRSPSSPSSQFHSTPNILGVWRTGAMDCHSGEAPPCAGRRRVLREPGKKT